VSKKKLRHDVSAMAFLNSARSYHGAANRLFESQPFRDPTYFLYFHTVELLLKAFLRSENVPILGTRRQSHRLTDLYEECRNLGLVIGQHDGFEIGNIVSLLDSGNEYQAFRYFNLESQVMPDLRWTHEVVEQLMRAVESKLGAPSPQNVRPGRGVKGVMVIGQPVPQDDHRAAT
jgi:hypothetical protein